MTLQFFFSVLPVHKSNIEASDKIPDVKPIPGISRGGGWCCQLSQELRLQWGRGRDRSLSNRRHLEDRFRSLEGLLRRHIS
ncbi:hypothetical protein TNCV_3828171 [Trichonephila clavipes]|nr:hypothetical protein TNCV_3828171 [Trichonephila clavipes]